MYGSEVKIYRSKKPIFISISLPHPSVYTPFMRFYDSKDFEIDKLEQFVENNDEIIGISLYGDICNLGILKKVIHMCSVKNIKISVDVNCNKSNLDLLDEVSSNIELSRVTLLSFDKYKHNRYYSGFNNYDDVLCALRDIEKYKIRVLNFPLLDDNICEINEVYSFCREKNIKFNPIFVPNNVNGKLSGKKFKIFMDTIKTINDYENLYLDFPASFEVVGKSCICPAMRFSIDILGNNLRVCKFSDESIGNIDAVKEVWDSFDFKFSEKCKKCGEFNLCGGGCLLNRDNALNVDEYCQKYFVY